MSGRRRAALLHTAPGASADLARPVVMAAILAVTRKGDVNAPAQIAGFRKVFCGLAGDPGRALR